MMLRHAIKDEDLLSPLSIKWTEINTLSKQGVSFEVIAQKLEEYKKLLTSEKDTSYIHFVRAANVDFMLQNFSSSAELIAKSVSSIRSANIQVSPLDSVNASFMQFIFRMSDAFQVVLPRKYRTSFKNNLFNQQQDFDTCQEVLLLPLPLTINADTLKASLESTKQFCQSDHKVTYAIKNYQADNDYQENVKKSLASIQLFVDWLEKIENDKRHGFSMTFNDSAELQNVVDTMKNPQLANVIHFYRLKMNFLTIVDQFYKILGVEDYPYVEQRNRVDTIGRALIAKNNELWIESMDENPVKKIPKKPKPKIIPFEPARLTVDSLVSEPKYYLDTVFLIKRYELQDADLVAAVSAAKPKIDALFSQVDKETRLHQYGLFAERFGKTQSIEILKEYGVFRFFVEDNKPVSEKAEKSFATLSVHR